MKKHVIAFAVKHEKTIKKSIVAFGFWATLADIITTIGAKMGGFH